MKNIYKKKCLTCHNLRLTQCAQHHMQHEKYHLIAMFNLTYQHRTSYFNENKAYCSVRRT